jgi:hypothetical protein
MLRLRAGGKLPEYCSGVWQEEQEGKGRNNEEKEADKNHGDNSSGRTRLQTAALDAAAEVSFRELIKYSKLFVSLS